MLRSLALLRLFLGRCAGKGDEDVAVATDEGVSDGHIQAGLAEFSGVGRRFEVLGRFLLSGRDVTLIDDYGHHPTEVKATIEAVRAGWPDQRLVMVYQPHRYTRTRELFMDFVDVLSQVDLLILTDVYAAGEDRITGATGADLYAALKDRTEVHFVEAMNEVSSLLPDWLSDGDLLVTQGAGETTRLARELSELWSNQEISA